MTLPQKSILLYHLASLRYFQYQYKHPHPNNNQLKIQPLPTFHTQQIGLKSSFSPFNIKQPSSSPFPSLSCLTVVVCPSSFNAPTRRLSVFPPTQQSLCAHIQVNKPIS